MHYDMNFMSIDFGGRKYEKMQLMGFYFKLQKRVKNK